MLEQTGNLWALQCELLAVGWLLADVGSGALKGFEHTAARAQH